jgi:Ca2+-binding RTX toxin-like protein
VQFGNDKLQGGGGNDELYGDIANTTFAGPRFGQDKLYGGAGNDLLVGDATGMSGAQGGNDRLDGGIGDDLLYGDAFSKTTGAEGGADRFVFAPGSGHDRIADFEHHKDTIDLSRYEGIDDVFEVQSHFTQRGDDTVIDLGAAAGGHAGDNILTLTGIQLETLDAADFLFA